MIWICLALCFSGFSALSLSTERHYGQVLEGKGAPAARLTLRLFGWLLLGGAIAPCVIESGPSVGLAVWAAMLSLAASVLILLLTYKPRLIIPLALGAPSLTLSLLLL